MGSKDQTLEVRMERISEKMLRVSNRTWLISIGMLVVSVLMVVATVLSVVVAFRSNENSDGLSGDIEDMQSQIAMLTSQPRVGTISCVFTVPAKNTRSHLAGEGGIEVVSASALNLEVQVTRADVGLPEPRQNINEWISQFPNANGPRGTLVLQESSVLTAPIIVSEGQYLEFVNVDDSDHEGYFGANYRYSKGSVPPAYGTSC